MEYLKTLKSLFALSHHWAHSRCIVPRYCSNLANTSVTPRERRATEKKLKSRVYSGPSFQDFIKGVSVKRPEAADGENSDEQTYLSEDWYAAKSRKG